jgi:hypothetical protein
MYFFVSHGKTVYSQVPQHLRLRSLFKHSLSHTNTHNESLPLSNTPYETRTYTHTYSHPHMYAETDSYEDINDMHEIGIVFLPIGHKP